jgi:hypothetical protein
LVYVHKRAAAVVMHRGGPGAVIQPRGQLTVGTTITNEEIEARFAAVDEKIAAVDAALARCAEKGCRHTLPAALQWTMDEDGSTWRAELPDGRTAVIERLDDGESFLPKVHESRQDFAVGPVCAGLLGAAAWAAEFAAAAK